MIGCFVNRAPGLLNTASGSPVSLLGFLGEDVSSIWILQVSLEEFNTNLSVITVSQEKATVCVYVCVCVCVCALNSVQLFVTSWTVACQAPLSMSFFRQEYWSGLPFPSPED